LGSTGDPPGATSFSLWLSRRIFENSPAFQRRDSGPKDELSPEGTIERDTSAPSGLRFLESQPRVEIERRAILVCPFGTALAKASGIGRVARTTQLGYGIPFGSFQQTVSGKTRLEPYGKRMTSFLTFADNCSSSKEWDKGKKTIMKNTLRHVGWIFSLAICLGSLGCAGTRTEQSTGEVIDSSAITAKIKAALVDDPMVSAMQIKVKTFRGVVQLSGFVDQPEQRERAQKIAEGIDGVREIRNDIVVKSRVSQLTP
jgi:hyperosmotically inducible periplasmic protein